MMTFSPLGVRAHIGPILWFLTHSGLEHYGCYFADIILKYNKDIGEARFCIVSCIYMMLLMLNIFWIWIWFCPRGFNWQYI